jgi:DNA-binding transcriptional ArsR family regulator
MLRIHFTGQDLARTTIAGEPDPLWEVLLSLHVLQSRDPGPALGAWHRHTRRGIPRLETRLLAELAPPAGYAPDFLTPPGPHRDLGDALEVLLSTPRRQVGADLDHLAVRRPPTAWTRSLATTDRTAMRRLGHAIQQYHRVALAPYWDSIRRCVAADRAHRADLLASRGVEAVLETLHPRVRWEAPVLTVLDLPDADLHLEGRGLTLQPSYFCSGVPTRLRDAGLPPTLVYPVRRGSTPLQASPGESEDGDRASDAPRPAPRTVAALLGRTRANALEAIAGGCTTSQLAKLCDISLAAASHHATVLREAGLINTRRDGRSVLHEITHLGHHLLASTPAPSLS